MNRKLAAAVGCVVLTLVASRAFCAEQAQRAKSVTVYPVRITPGTNIAESVPVRLAEVVGLHLERAGMTRIEIGQAAFQPPASGDLAHAFGRFVKEASLPTEYALFAQIDGQPDTGISKIHIVVVDKAGNPVLVEQDDAKVFAQARFKPTNPMTASLFLVERLGQVWQLGNPLRRDAPQGKMAARLRKRSGLPPQEELHALPARRESFKQNAATTRVTVYPVHLWKGWDAGSAQQLVSRLNDAGVFTAQATEQIPQLDVAGDPNQQKVLWDTARAFRQFLRDHPAPTPYALLVDYGLAPGTDADRQASHVHLILCQGDGSWVLVDYQNSHHRDFQQVAPKTREQCHRLVLMRLTERLGK